MPSPLALDQTQRSPMAPEHAPPRPRQDNFNAAMADMKLNPQEQNLYQMHLENLHGPGGVTNPDGSRSTLFQTTIEMDGKTYVLPTVWGGKIVSPDNAVQFARQYGLEKFPTYGSVDEAEARYQQMHQYMERDMGAVGN